MLTAESIRKSFPTRSGDLPVLRDVSLTLSSGDSIAIMGPSGSGKSTLLNILGTLEAPNAGHLRIGDVEPFTLSEHELARFRNRRIGFIFQDHHLMPQCTVLENVLLPTLAGNASDDAPTRAHELLEQVGLSNRLDHQPAELSGGEKQRVAIARALINQPAVVLADEPTGNLDRATGDRIGDLLADLPERQATSLVVVTHSQHLAGRFRRILDLADGVLNPR